MDRQTRPLESVLCFAWSGKKHDFPFALLLFIMVQRSTTRSSVTNQKKKEFMLMFGVSRLLPVARGPWIRFVRKTSGWTTCSRRRRKATPPRARLRQTARSPADWSAIARDPWSDRSIADELLHVSRKRPNRPRHYLKRPNHPKECLKHTTATNGTVGRLHLGLGMRSVAIMAPRRVRLCTLCLSQIALGMPRHNSQLHGG